MKRTAARAPRRLLAAIATGALALGGVVATPLVAQAAEVEVTGVTFDWGLNNESSGGAYFGGCNFLSAGEAGDTTSARLWTQADGFYQSSDGNTRIVKPTADGTGLQEPTWATKCQTPGGVSVNGRTNAQAADNHTSTRVQIANGSGTVDVAANTAEIQWDGSFTVAYYGGMTYWSVTDPKLVVDADGTGTVTATFSGYGTDMDDTSIWNRLEPREVTLADLTGVDVTAAGFTVTPDYLGVSVPEDVAGRNAQAERTAENESWWGSFPADFLRFQQLTGQDSYWYTTPGGATTIQPRKATLPLTVDYDAPDAPAVPVITTQPATQSATLGQDATFSVTADDATGYQWQSSPDGSTWTDIAGATSRTHTVAATSATAALQYRVVVGGAGGSATSEAVTIQLSVPEPTVTVSKTEGLDPAGETVTVTGSGFVANPPATNGAAGRGPLAGVFSGAYIAFGKFADSWQPSTGAASSARPADRANTKWGVHAEHLDTVGGTSGGAIEIRADGTFETTLTLTKDYSGVPETGNFGVYTYPGGSSGYAAFETYTPVSFAVQVPDAPAAPTAVLGADGASVDVSWTAPDAGGEAISGYDVTLTPSTGEASTVSVAGDVTTASFSDLARGVSYTATVVARNAGGASAASPASAAVEVPAAAPDAPATPTATAASATSVNVSWTAPADGGSAITGYTVQVWQGSTEVATEQVAGDVTTATVDGLQAATTYSVTVAATNAVGSSAASAPAPVTTPDTAPGALEAPTATAASGTELNVSWTAPADGGAAITGYVVTVLRGSDVAATAEVAGDVTTTTVGGLAPGTAYTVTVAAVTATGTGPASPASAPVTTHAAPQAPVVTAALAGSTGVSASWSAPADGGSPITGYVATLSGAGSSQQRELAASATGAEFTGLAAGEYTVSVVAVNAVGSSAAGVSNAVTVSATTPVEPTAPAAPSAPGVALGSDGASVTITWSAPADGGSPITGYRVELGTGSSGDSIDVAADARSHVVTGLAAGAYQVWVTAVNAVGETTSAASSIDVPGAAPTGEPELLTDDDLAGDSFGDARITVEGDTITIELGAARANSWFGVAVNSDPQFVGWFLSGANGAITATLPAGLEPGQHHVVVYDADGAVVAYQAFAISSDGTGTGGTGSAGSAGGAASAGTSGALAATGSDAATLWPVLGFGMLLIAAGVALTLRRATRSRPE